MWRKTVAVAATDDPPWQHIRQVCHNLLIVYNSWPSAGLSFLSCTSDSEQNIGQSVLGLGSQYGETDHSYRTIKIQSLRSHSVSVQSWEGEVQMDLHSHAWSRCEHSTNPVSVSKHSALYRKLAQDLQRKLLIPTKLSRVHCPVWATELAF